MEQTGQFMYSNAVRVENRSYRIFFHHHLLIIVPPIGGHLFFLLNFQTFSLFAISHNIRGYNLHPSAITFMTDQYHFYGILLFIIFQQWIVAASIFLVNVTRS